MALSTDYTWAWEVTQIRKSDRQNSEGATLSNAVVQSFWKLTGTNASGQSGEFSGATPLDPTNTPAGSFVAFEDLTESTVLSWIQNIVTSDQGYCDHISERVTAAVQEELTQDAAMPWAPEEEEVTPPVPADAVDPAEEDDGGE